MNHTIRKDITCDTLNYFNLSPAIGYLSKCFIIKPIGVTISFGMSYL